MGAMKTIIWYLIAGTRGGLTRGRILNFLRETPSNANKLAESLKLDYKTVRHHLEVLTKNNAIYAIDKDKYGAVYFLTEALEADIAVFEEIWNKVGSNLGKT